MTSRTRARPLAAALAVAALVAASLAGGASAQQDRTQAEIERYREMLKDGNPAELVSAKGEGVSKRGTALNFSKGGTGLSMGSSEFRDSALGDAQERACQDIVKRLVARADRLE